MKKSTFIRSLALFLLSPAFLLGAAQASIVFKEPGLQGSLSNSGIFQTAVLFDDDIGPDGLKRRGDGSIDDTQPGQVSVDDDIGPDGLKRRGDGSIDDTQPGQEDNDRPKMRGRNRGHGNKDDGMDNSMRTDNSGKGRMDRLDRDNRGRGQGQGRGRHGRIERPERQDRSGRSHRVERPERQDRSGRPERIERPERQDRSGRPERVERPDRSGRPERPDNSGHGGRD